MWRGPDYDPVYSSTLELDLGDVEPSLAGPKRPQDKVALSDAAKAFGDVVLQHRAPSSREERKEDWAHEGGRPAPDISRATAVRTRARRSRAPTTRSATARW